MNEKLVSAQFFVDFPLREYLRTELACYARAELRRAIFAARADVERTLKELSEEYKVFPPLEGRP